jgi:nucleotide-binding universal stress UspA family protein
MKAIIWVADESWQATVDAAIGLVPESAETTLLYVIDTETSELAHGAFASLFGRARPGADPGTLIDKELQRSADELLADAIERFGRQTSRHVIFGRKAEHEVVEFCTDADLLVMARDGDETHAGPRSLGRAGRFVVDHAPCQVLLVWSVTRDEIDTHYPSPPHGPGHHRPHHHPPHDRHGDRHEPPPPPR